MITPAHLCIRLHPPQTAQIDSVKLEKTIREVVGNPFFISSYQVTTILEQNPGLTIDRLLQELVPIAQFFARPPISDYKVGVVGLGLSGNIYLGVNLEFGDLPATIHGEQFMTINARNHGEQYITKMALSAAPCGCCRQFLNEIGNQPGMRASDINFLIPQKPLYTLGQLLPEAFGPGDLGVQGGLLSPMPIPNSLNLYERARQAAVSSYAPYSKCPSGVALQLKDGRIFSGSYVENAAFNPAVPPLTSALVSVVAASASYQDIVSIVLCENATGTVRQGIPTMDVIQKICPNAQFNTINP
ncbi:MAG: cytidine deaminase [Verrucomicrobia bacterium]|nr:cytidine deaminase [Verrucomicrobiota bacterium]MBS0636932.1 cytidine deaminase [Verrucomicrobiota bacterium]